MRGSRPTSGPSLDAADLKRQLKLNAGVSHVVISAPWIPAVELMKLTLPVGMQILTRHFDEPGMFRLAAAFERTGGFAV